MTTVKIERNGGLIYRYTVSGHSGYREEGEDIVCAAISTLTQAAILGLNFYGANPEVKRKDGYLRVTVPQLTDTRQQMQAQALLETMALGLKDISEGYSAFIRLEE